MSCTDVSKFNTELNYLIKNIYINIFCTHVVFLHYQIWPLIGLDTRWFTDIAVIRVIGNVTAEIWERWEFPLGNVSVKSNRHSAHRLPELTPAISMFWKQTSKCVCPKAGIQTSWQNAHGAVEKEVDFFVSGLTIILIKSLFTSN